MDPKLFGGGFYSRKSEGFSEHHVTGGGERQQRIEQNGLIPGIDDQAVGARVWHPRTKPLGGHLPFFVAATGSQVVEVSTETRLILNGFEAPRDAHIEIRLHRLWRHGHPEIDFALERDIRRRPRRSFRNQRASSHPRITDSAPPGL